MPEKFWIELRFQTACSRSGLPDQCRRGLETTVQDAALRAGCVSIEYLERKLDAIGLKGNAARIAIQYAEALAAYFELAEVRVCDPDPILIEFYEQNFGLTRQSGGDAVPYLFKKVH